MVALTPVQAAAMAAERRLQDDIWCGSGSCEDTEDRESNPGALQDIANVIESERNLQNGIPSRQVSDSVSKKTSRDLDDRSTLRSLKKSKHSTFMDLTGDASTSQSTLSCHSKKHQERRPESEGGLDSKFKYDGTFTSTDVSSSLPSRSKHTQNATDNAEEFLMWECGICTLLNPPLAPVCKVCGEQRPIAKDAKLKYWSCKFCTLDNSVNLDRCSACQQWRYSNGPPVSSYAPHRGD